MIKRKKLTSKQVRQAIDDREFGADVAGSKKRVAVVMTQSWCPQWTMMQDWLTDYEDPGDLDLYELVYDKSELFAEFLELKESAWKNGQIPYIRYYRNGKLVKESNYASRDRFDANFGG
jgi:hypothetical protein